MPTAADPVSRSTRAIVTRLALGLLLLAAYVALERALPRGAVEFAYVPDIFQPLPWAAIRGAPYEQVARYGLRLALVAPALALLAAGAGRAASIAPPAAHWVARAATTATWAAPALVGVLMLGVLQARPLTDDELTYAAHARVLARGELADTSLPRFGQEAFTIHTRRGVSSKYLPGEAAVQVPGVLVGVAPVAHVPLLLLTLVAWRTLVRREAGAPLADASTLLLALSPLLLLTSATGLSHATTLALVVLAGLGASLARDRPLSGALTSAVALAMCAWVRPQVAAAALSTLGVWTLVRLVRRRAFVALAALAAVLAASAGAIAAYDYWLTGSATTLPWSLYHPQERLGFGRPLEGSSWVHTPLRGGGNVLLSLLRFDAFFLGVPGTLALLALAARHARGSHLRPWVALAMAEALLLVLYYSPGIGETGPIYAYEWSLLGALVGASGLVSAIERWGRRALVWTVVVAVAGTAGFCAEQAARLRRQVEVVHGPARRIVASLPRPALLVHEHAPQEMLFLGWVYSFPLRQRSDADAVVTFPRGGPGMVAALRARFPGRRCLYLRMVKTERGARSEVRGCDEARPLLERPAALAGPPLMLPSTARRLGLVSRRLGADRARPREIR